MLHDRSLITVKSDSPIQLLAFSFTKLLLASSPFHSKKKSRLGHGFFTGHSLGGRTGSSSINLDLSTLTERFQTRFLSVRLQPPSSEVLAQFMATHWNAPISITRMIATGASGNVRAALADLEMWLG